MSKKDPVSYLQQKLADSWDSLRHISFAYFIREAVLQMQADYRNLVELVMTAHQKRYYSDEAARFSAAGTERSALARTRACGL
jgi:hypothetical protein